MDVENLSLDTATQPKSSMRREMTDRPTGSRRPAREEPPRQNRYSNLTNAVFPWYGRAP